MRVFEPWKEFKFQDPDDYDKKVGKIKLNDAGFRNLDRFLLIFQTHMIVTKKLEKNKMMRVFNT